MASLIQYLKNVRAEFVHIRWPSRREAVAHTLAVIFITAVTALLAAVLDLLFTDLLRQFIG